MCGIFARIAPLNDPLREVVPVPHRGPDAEGFETLEVAGQRITLAHWRLSIIDLHACSDQPFRRTPGGPVIVFNGEIYNYIELRKRTGGEFRTASDTEVLLAAYEKWGTGCLAHLRGMFAFVIVDPARKRVFAARDRFGIKPLYFTHTDGSWEFASEIKQLAGKSPRINIARARDFLLFGAQDHTAETMFDGIMQLRGGESLAIDLERPSAATPTSWYDLPPPGRFGANYEDATRAFREKFFDTVSLHMRSDVPVGFCLSGGMDSSALIGTAGALARESGHELCGIHCHYNVAKLDERQHAQDAATLAGARLLEVSPDPAELASELSTITRFQDEPLNNASLFSQYRVFRAAQEHGLKVMVDGQGGDELLASYPQFFGPYLLGLLKGLKIPAFFAESAHFREDHGWGWLNTLHSLALWFTPRPIFRAAKYLGSGLAHPWAKRDFFMGEGMPMPPWQRPDRIETGATTRSMSLLMIRQLTLPMLLHWEDRNSMAHSVESRVPFLDHELVEMALSLPDEFKIHRGVTKRILKSALRDIVPPAIVGRRDKLGFATPEELWMRRPGSEFADLIRGAADQCPEIFDAIGLEHTWDKFVDGAPYNPVLWRIAMFTVWARVFNMR